MPKGYTFLKNQIKGKKYQLRDSGVDVKELIKEKKLGEYISKLKLEGKTSEANSIVQTFQNEKEFSEFKSYIFYETDLAAIKREGQNLKIQAASADITKIAIKDLYEYFLETGYGFLTFTVHDSISFELLEKYFHIAFPKCIEIMENAAKKVIPSIKAPVDPSVGWETKVICPICNTNKIKMYNMDFIDNKLYKDINKIIEIKNIKCDECNKKPA